MADTPPYDFDTMLTSRGLYLKGFDADLVATYGGVAGADCSAALQAFYNDPNARRLLIPYNALGYSFGTQVNDTSTVDKHVFVEPDTTLWRTAKICVVRSIAQLDWVEAISSQSLVTTDIGEQANATTPHTELVIGNARTVARGSVLKVVSDDLLLNGKPNGASANQRRMGEHVITAAALGDQTTVGTTLILTSILRDTYATVPRVAKINEKRFSWEGGKFVDVNLLTNTTDIGMIDCVGLIRPELIGLSFENVYGTGIRLTGCFSPVVDNAKGKLLHNMASSAVYGYLINEVACTGARITRPYGNAVRHVVTTNTDVVPVASGEGANSTMNIHEHGRSRQGHVTQGYGVGCANSPFDTHDETEDYLFDHCISVGAFSGPDSGGGGFTCRGYGTKFVGCEAYWCRNGFALGGIDRTELINCKVVAATYTALQINLSTVINQNSRVVIRGGSYQAIGIAGCLVVGTSASYVADVYLDGPTFLVSGTNAIYKALVFNGAKVRGKNIKIDLTEYTPATPVTIKCFDLSNFSNSDVQIDGVEITMPASPNANFGLSNLVYSSTTNTSTVRLTNVKYEGTLDFVGASVNGNIFAIHANMTGAVAVGGEKNVSGTTTNTQYFAATMTAASLLNVDKVTNNDMLARISSASAVTAGTLSVANRRNGDVLRIVNNGTFGITIGGITVAGPGYATLGVANGAWTQIG